MRVYIDEYTYFNVDIIKVHPGRLAEILYKELYKPPSQRRHK